LVIILNLICVVALFTASVANSGPYETPYRLHMRYYNFALPLFYLIAAGALNVKADVFNSVRFFLGIVFAALGIYATWTNLVPYTPNHIDSPEICGLHVDGLYFHVIGGLLISALTLWLFMQRKGLQIYLYLALPLFVILSTCYVEFVQNKHLKQDIYDQAGIFTKQYLTDKDISKVVIVGSEPSGLFRSLYYLDNARASIEIVQRDAIYNMANLPAGKEWILVIGDHEIVGMPLYQISMNGFALIRASGENVLDFKKGAWPGIIRKVKGLSTPEPWGTWSKSDVVVFEFAVSLPRKFEIHLVAHAFGPNVDKEFEATVGENFANFTLSSNDQQEIIRLENPTNSNVLRLKIPNAVSPKALELSEDDRKLGIGFVEMKIVTIN
jgi:phosphoglycerol transferase